MTGPGTSPAHGLGGFPTGTVPALVADGEANGRVAMTRPSSCPGPGSACEPAPRYLLTQLATLKVSESHGVIGPYSRFRALACTRGRSTSGISSKSITARSLALM